MANGIHKYTVSEGVNLQLGQAGFDVITQGDGAQSGHWIAVYIPDDAEQQIDATSAIGDSISNLMLCANGIIYGNFTSITAETSSKSVIAYRGS